MAHSDKLKSLEALKNLSTLGKKLEAVKEKELQKRDPKAKIFVLGIHKAVTQQIFFDTFKTFGKMEFCVLKKTKAGGSSKGGVGIVQY